MRPNNGDIIDLHLESLAIDSTSEEVMGPMVKALAKLARLEPIAAMVPDLAAAQLAVSSFTIARILRGQWLPARTRFDELSRTWWIARRIDQKAAHLDRANRILGMPVPTFVRAATALLAFAVVDEPRGYVNLNRPVDEEFASKYDVDHDTLRLAAFKLSTTRSDLRIWLDDLQKAPSALRHHAPNPLSTTPLLSVDGLVTPAPAANTVYLCPSIFHFIGAVRDRVREAISGPSDMNVDTQALYGDVLSDYVRQCATGAGDMYSVDAFDGDERRGDWLLVNEKSGLIIEVKRAIATGALSRHLLTPNGMSAVLKQPYGAYEQCRSTASRRNWRGLCGRLHHVAALVLVDEPVGAEGAVVAELLSRRTVVGVDPPFEVMSVAEFENAIHTLGVQRLVSRVWLSS